MSDNPKTPVNKIIAGATEAVAVAKGEKPAASVWVNGHKYVSRPDYDKLRADLATARKALEFIAEGYENHDVNHVDYRVRVYQIATETLAEIAHLREI